MKKVICLVLLIFVSLTLVNGVFALDGGQANTNKSIGDTPNTVETSECIHRYISIEKRDDLGNITSIEYVCVHCMYSYTVYY